MLVATDARSFSVTRLLLPDAALAVSVVTLFLGLLMGDGPAKFFRDSDTGWHIRTGESLLAGNPMPRSDPYSFTKPGQPWFAWEWGSDVIMGAAHRSQGLPGVALLFSAAAAVATWLWFQLHWSAGGNFFFACVMAACLLSSVHLHWLARPHVFSWILALLAMLLLEGAPSRPRLRHGAAFALLGMAWANLHASFFFLPALALAYCCGDLLSAWLFGTQDSRWRWFTAMALCGAAGSLLNPYGWQLHAHVLAYLANHELLSRIGEFQSFNFHAEGAGQIAVTLLLTVAGGVLSWANRRPEHALICLALAVLSLRSARAIPMAALIGLPLANAALTAALARIELRPALRNALDNFLAYSTRVRKLDAQAGGFILAPAALALAFVILQAPALAAKADFPADRFPLAAAAAVEKLPAEARLLAPDLFGGYLIYRFRGERKVFFDGRSDFYGVEFMKKYIDLIEARPGWRTRIGEFGFTHALLPNRYTLVDGLQSEGWKQIYRDDTATLLQRN